MIIKQVSVHRLGADHPDEVRLMLRNKETGEVQNHTIGIELLKAAAQGVLTAELDGLRKQIEQLEAEMREIKERAEDAYYDGLNAPD